MVLIGQEPLADQIVSILSGSFLESIFSCAVHILFPLPVGYHCILGLKDTEMMERLVSVPFWFSHE